MKEAILLQAKYNQFANKNLFNLLETLNIETLNKRVGTYFESPLNVIEHYVTSSIVFFARNLRPCATKNICMDEVLGSMEVDFVLKKEYKNDIKKLKSVVEIIDSKIIEIIENTSDFNLKVSMTFPSGISVEKSCGHLFLTFLNHNTHHRGELSAMLEILQIPNNFAGMLLM